MPTSKDLHQVEETWKLLFITHIKLCVLWLTLREYCEEEMWVWLFPHHKCQKILSNHESKTSYLTSFWHEWCGKTNTHISNLTVFTLLKTTITQIWHFFFEKFVKSLVKCEHEFYGHFVKCVDGSFFNSFFTIVFFNNAVCL